MRVAKKKKKARPRKKRAAPPVIEQTDEGVRITHPGRILRAPGPDKAVVRRSPPPVSCPYCSEEGREGVSLSKYPGAPGTGLRFYECTECCDPETGRPTRFKVFNKSQA